VFQKEKASSDNPLTHKIPNQSVPAAGGPPVGTVMATPNAKKSILSTILTPTRVQHTSGTNGVVETGLESSLADKRNDPTNLQTSLMSTLYEFTIAL
jgi:hypothetical protein